MGKPPSVRARDTRGDFDLEVWRHNYGTDPSMRSVVLRKVKNGRGRAWIILKRPELEKLLHLIKEILNE